MAFRNLLQKEVDAHDNESKRETLQLLKLGAFNEEVKRQFRVVRSFSIALAIHLYIYISPGSCAIPMNR